jgi:hypothetical protein
VGPRNQLVHGEGALVVNLQVNAVHFLRQETETTIITLDIVLSSLGFLKPHFLLSQIKAVELPLDNFVPVGIFPSILVRVGLINAVSNS